MTHHKKFKDESQDARRHDQHDATHPDDKISKNQNKHPKNSSEHKAKK